MLVIVPTRSRPHNIEPVVTAWLETAAFPTADLLFAVDADDPLRDAYDRALEAQARRLSKVGATLRSHSLPRHEQLVPKLNGVAKLHADMSPQYIAMGFAGDDHLPQTYGWAGIMLDVLREMGTGIVYPDDGYQHGRIPTSWLMTTDIIRALGAMVPAPVEHLFCDNAVRDLGLGANCLRYLPEVLVEHMHPVAGKVASDEQYERVNSRDQWRADQRAYRGWRRGTLPRQAAQVRDLTTGERS